MYRKILVTGGSSSIGRSLKTIVGDYPHCEFVFISSRECDLTKIEKVAEFIKDCRPEAILHLAAGCGGIQLSIKHPATLLRDNVLMNVNILEAARFCNVKKVVMTLTTGMYPVETEIPIREESIHDGPPHGSNYGSSFAKRLVEPMIRAYREEYGLNVIGLVPNGILGEYSTFSPKAAIMPAALIRRCYENKNNNSKIVVWGDGSPLREITYATDIARAFMWSLNNYDSHQILNIGTTEEASVKDIAYMIADNMQIDHGRIEFDTSKPSGIFRKSTDNSKFVNLSHFEYTPLRKTIEYTVGYFCKNYPQGVRL